METPALEPVFVLSRINVLSVISAAARASPGASASPPCSESHLRGTEPAKRPTEHHVKSMEPY